MTANQEVHHLVMGKNRSSTGKSQSKDNRIDLFPDTPFEFDGQNMTPYGGLLPISALMERLEFGELCEHKIRIDRVPVSMRVRQFFMAIVMSLYVGYDRLYHVKYIRKDPMILGVLKIPAMPVQSTFHRFLMSMGREAEQGIREVGWEMRRRVWSIGNIELETVTIDTDTTVNTVYGDQEGATKGYNPKNKGKRSYMPVLSFLAETGECLTAYNRSGDRMSGGEVAEHIRGFRKIFPGEGIQIRCRTDCGFYCREAVEAYEEIKAEYIMVAQKTTKLQGKLESLGLTWEEIKDTDGVTEFTYQPHGWAKRYRFLAVRYELKDKEETAQPGLMIGKRYKYRTFVTNMEGSIWKLIGFYDGRAGCENLIKEAMHDAGIRSVPSKDFAANCNFFQLGVMAYNFNRWLQILTLKKGEQYQRERLMTQRLTLVYLAAKIVKHAGCVRLSYSNGYENKDRFRLLMERILRIRKEMGRYGPVMPAPQLA
jgi:hypothetical protein